jgi:hypothetical protein
MWKILKIDATQFLFWCYGAVSGVASQIYVIIECID